MLEFRHGLLVEIINRMSPEDMDILRAKSTVSVEEIVRKKTIIDLQNPLQQEDAPKAVDILKNTEDRSSSFFARYARGQLNVKTPKIHSGLSMTSRMTYFSDRILHPELLRAMGLMYLAGSPVRPNIDTDYYLSAVHAPDSMLARFPKTYFFCGEKDPLVDDSIIFSARIRDAKINAKAEWSRLCERTSHTTEPLTLPAKKKFSAEQELENHLFSKRPEDMIKLKIVPGMSHGIFQMCAFLPEANQSILLTSDWLREMFLEEALEEAPSELTNIMVSELNDVRADSVFLRRRNSIASKIGFDRTN